MYKLVAIDLDGTLLNSYGEVSKENKIAIQEAIQRGSEIVLASGRMPSSVKNIALELGADKYMICGNGTMVYDIKKEEVIYDAFMSKEKALEIIKICEENSIYYNVYTKNNVLAKSLNYNILFYNNENSKKPLEKRTNINIVEDIAKYIKETPDLEILKMTVCDSDQVIFASIIRKLKMIADVDVLEIEHMSRKNIKHGTTEVAIEYYYTEVSNKNANKWTAIEFLMQKLNIAKEEVMAIGDNANDKEMVEKAGLGVAMGKSMLAANHIGDIEVKDNNSSGVAEAINRYINYS